MIEEGYEEDALAREMELDNDRYRGGVYENEALPAHKSCPEALERSGEDMASRVSQPVPASQNKPAPKKTRKRKGKKVPPKEDLANADVLMAVHGLETPLS